MATRKSGDASEENGAILPAKAGEITDGFLRSVGNLSGDAFTDALDLVTTVYGDVKEASEELGNGFGILSDKSVLVGKEMLIISWKWHDGDHGPFVSAPVVTRDGGRYILNDGSTGIAGQLRVYENATGRDGGLRVKQGLRVSSYSTCPGCSLPRDSRTEECENTLKNGTKCGDTDTARGTGETYYIDLTS